MLDKTSFGRFDFMYLRIDFKHGCNVGYASINFVGLEVIIAFANEHQNRRCVLDCLNICTIIAVVTVVGTC
jgi:hypothetical protein